MITFFESEDFYQGRTAFSIGTSPLRISKVW
ncbi:MAG: hypothetical protein ACI9UV_002839, partial [Algoriphagus sp.]